MKGEISLSSALILGAELSEALTTYSEDNTVFLNGVFFFKKHNYPRNLIGVPMRDVQGFFPKGHRVILRSMISECPDRT